MIEEERRERDREREKERERERERDRERERERERSVLTLRLKVSGGVDLRRSIPHTLSSGSVWVRRLEGRSNTGSGQSFSVNIHAALYMLCHARAPYILKG